MVFYVIAPWKPSWEIFQAVLPAAVPFFLGGITLYYALFNSDVSIIGGLQTLKLVPLVFLTNIILGESFSFLTYVLIGVLVVSSLFVIIDEKVEWSDFFNWPIFLAFVSSSLFALSDVYMKQSFAVLSPISVMSANLFCSAIFSLVFIPFITQKLKKVSFNEVKIITLNSTMTFAVVVLLVLAFETNVTISNVISNLTGPFALIFTYIFGKFKPSLLESHTKRVYMIRISGVILSYLAAVGIIILTV